MENNGRPSVFDIESIFDDETGQVKEKYRKDQEECEYKDEKSETRDKEDRAN